MNTVGIQLDCIHEYGWSGQAMLDGLPKFPRISDIEQMGAWLSVVERYHGFMEKQELGDDRRRV